MKWIRCLSIISFFTLMPCQSVGQVMSTEIDGIRWTYTISNGEASVETGTNSSAVPDSTRGSIAIPSVLGDCPVTSIGDYAFYRCCNLTSISIPNGVTCIGDNAFYYCYNLTSIEIPNSVTCIGVSAFERCFGLTAFAIPNSVTNIGDNAFYYCSEMSSIEIGNGVTSIGDSAFHDCYSLKSVTIPDSVTNIGQFAFYRCPSMTSITIGKGLMSIGDRAFDLCSGLVEVHMSDLDAWCRINFSSVEANPCYYAHHLFLHDQEIFDLIIPDSLTSIEKWTFFGCSSLTSVVIPDSVTSIGYQAFYGCSGLTSIAISDSVASIADWAFSGCSRLMSLAIPDSMTSIGEGAFSGCSGLVSVSIPDGVMRIEDFVFSRCSNLTTISFPNALLDIGNSAFSGCSNLTMATIPNGVTNIGERAFQDCSKLISIVLPNDATSIGDYAFMNCTNLTSVTIPDGVVRIGGNAFKNCTNLASVTIPNGVARIGDYAFAGCSGLASVLIPNSVTSIVNGVFSGCGEIRTIVIPGRFRLASVFSLSYQNITNASVAAGSSSIDYSAFSDCSALVSVVIPNSVTNIGERAFQNCSGLTSITIPDSVTHIGAYAFSGCSGLETIFLPRHFPGNTGYIPNGCQVIRYDANPLLDVTSAHGTCIPAPGQTTLKELSLVSAHSIPDEPLNGVRYICTGWTGTGSVPSSGSGTNVTFTIAENSSLTWIWRKENQVSLSVMGSGTCDFGSQWIESGTMAVATIVPSSNHYVVVLSGDTNGVVMTGSTLSIPSDRPREITATVEPRIALDVQSAYGIATPSAGTHLFVSGDEVSSSVSVPADANGTRRIFTGWTGTGSVPASGTGTNVSFRIETDSSLTWNWRTEYWIDLTVSGATANFASQWVEAGAEIVVEIVPMTHLYTISLSGDTEGTTLDGTTLRFSANGPRSIRVEVEEEKIPFAVSSQWGSPSPATGAYVLSWGDEVAANIAEPEPVNGIQYVCTGWTGTGCVPASGMETNVTFTVTEDSSIRWNWQTNYWLDCRVSIDGRETNVVGWVPFSTDSFSSPIEHVSSPVQVAISGDTNGVIVDIAAGTISFLADGPRTVSVLILTYDGYGNSEGKPVVLSNGGDADWFPVADVSAADGFCLRSGEIEAGETSATETTLVGPGTLSFKWKVPAGRGDYARAYLDEEQQAEINREEDWLEESIAIPAGEHVVLWSYERGSGSASGEDAAFLDDVDWRPQVSLTVASAFGTTSPAAGTHTLAYGDEVAAFVATPEPADGTRRVCTGWTGTGSVPAGGTETNVAFRIEEDSSISWNWRTDHWIDLAASGPVEADFSEGWIEQGSNVVVRWAPAAPYFTIALSGDTDGAILDEEARTLLIPADRQRSVTLAAKELTLAGALDGQGLRWTTDGAATWFPQIAETHDGEDAAKSGSVLGDDTSALEVALEGGGTFAWSWRIDAVGNVGVDVLLDGRRVRNIEPASEWGRETLAIEGDGQHTVRFEFWNEGTSATLDDCAYLDEVSWTGEVPGGRTTLESEVPVPFAWLDEHNLVERGDYEAASVAVASNGVNQVWECYVAGLDPTSATNRFLAEIVFDGSGEPRIIWTPDLGAARRYIVEGKTNLVDKTWGPTNESTRFFRVEVGMPE